MKLKCEGNTLLKETLPVARLLLQELIRVHEEFHVKVEESGPPKLPKYDDGHKYTMQQRCYGDGHDPADCGRLFIKVRMGFVHSIYLFNLFESVQILTMSAAPGDAPEALSWVNSQSGILRSSLI